MKIGDLISTNNTFWYDTSSLINTEQRLFLMSIMYSIPTEWHSLIKVSIKITITETFQVFQLSKWQAEM